MIDVATLLGQTHFVGPRKQINFINHNKTVSFSFLPPSITPFFLSFLDCVCIFPGSERICTFYQFLKGSEIQNDKLPMLLHSKGGQYSYLQRDVWDQATLPLGNRFFDSWLLWAFSGSWALRPHIRMHVHSAVGIFQVFFRNYSQALS